MDCLHCLIDKEECPCVMLLIVCATSQASGSVLAISDELRVLLLDCSSLMYWFRTFWSPPWSADVHHKNPDELERDSCAHTQRWIDLFAGHTSVHCRKIFSLRVHPVTGYQRSIRSLMPKRQIFSRNVDGKFFSFYENYTCGLIPRW